MYTKLKIVFVDGTEIEVECDEFQAYDGILKTWYKGGVYGQWGQRQFPIANIREYSEMQR
jgi:hypothetical protein